MAAKGTLYIKIALSSFALLAVLNYPMNTMIGLMHQVTNIFGLALAVSYVALMAAMCV
jgi:hypothetical protein